MTDGAVIEWLRDLGLPADAPPVRLTGGLLNEVWRCGRLIVKHAPPVVASAPHIPLDPGRMVIEAQCLELFGPGGRLASIATPDARPPRLVARDDAGFRMVMEDAGEAPHLGQWLEQGRDAVSVGNQLGRFIGELHRNTMGDAELALALDNPSIQQTRLEIQYRVIAGILERCGVPDAAALGAEAEALGERLLLPGRCVIMGDLWPASVLVTPAGMRVIDWELAHYGNPAQDVAHLAAHLWMIEHRGKGPGLACYAGFREAYRNALGRQVKPLWDEQTRRDAGIHMACEILVRSAGAFQAGSLYDGLDVKDAAVRQAVHRAVTLLRGAPPDVGLFAALRP